MIVLSFITLNTIPFPQLEEIQMDAHMGYRIYLKKTNLAGITNFKKDNEFKLNVL